ncbi:MAG TPA: ADP-ribosylation factor-like protein [Candidatus Lokiarchaeia archaeon]|nr:ADP-ribosylation factor-like protein [Candidatus Lokiarchaeia archaeon]
MSPQKRTTTSATEPQCTELLIKARRDGFIDKLAFHLDRKEMEEVQSTLASIQALAGEDSLASVRLLSGDGTLIDQVGSLIALQTAGTDVPGSREDSILSVAVTSRPAEPKKCKILWTGIEASGKSAMLYRVKHGEFHAHKSTIGLNVEFIDFEGNDVENYEVTGHPALRESLVTSIAREEKVDAIIFAVDSSDPVKLPESIDYMQFVLDNKYLAGLPLAILATKQDVEGALLKEEIYAAFELDKKFKKPGMGKWTIIDVSAKTGYGVIDLLHFLATVLLRPS